MNRRTAKRRLSSHQNALMRKLIHTKGKAYVYEAPHKLFVLDPDQVSMFTATEPKSSNVTHSEAPRFNRVLINGVPVNIDSKYTLEEVKELARIATVTQPKKRTFLDWIIGR